MKLHFNKKSFVLFKGDVEESEKINQNIFGVNKSKSLYLRNIKTYIMKIRTIKELENTERHVKGVGFDSVRVLLEKDNMGFSLHKTIIPKGGPYNWHYKQHLESCYCIQGRGIITDLSSGESHNIEIDTTYILDNHDNHTFEALEDVVLISVFNPPVTGKEVHNSDGSYSINKH